MKKYIIHCTQSQAAKALELGAPIVNKYVMGEDGLIKHYELIPPTAEQMIGWLEEQGITVESVRCSNDWFARTYSDENTNFNKGRFSSRKEAMLSAIDTALKYLIQTKNSYGGN